MICISIPIAAYEAICATLPAGNVAVEPEANAKGEAHRLAGGRDGGSSIPSLGDGVMLGTAWIDRPVDTQGRAPCFHVLLSAAWKHGHAQANDRHSSRVFAMAPRGFARTTRNG
ncbi:MAG: hypothetical protein WB766_06395 [Roseiarcus sp.]